ncbi:helix-turn-helix domain-containing protein [Candidatus Poriferisodalis sp.]|uniref:AraC-like ligand-binding domain-containing protein n=1 Tax=Candidatus Poriferisodalis sp. TaxID=3101277 RepID=UPI003B5C5859
MRITETTAGVQDHERFDYWHEVICRTYVHIDAETLPSDRTFRAKLAASDLGRVTLSRVWAEPHCVRRSVDLIERQPHDTLMVSLMLRGAGILAQQDREVALGTGDASLYDGSQPFSLALPDRFDMIVLQFDREALVQRCPMAEELTASRLPAEAPAFAPVFSVLRSLQRSQIRDESALSKQFGASLLDILAVALAEHFGTATTKEIQRKQKFLHACGYINACTDDASLSPSQIASAIGVSLRYLHVLFHENGNSVSNYMFSRRIAKCYTDLVDPSKMHLSITDIAHSRGFKTIAHFSRRFSEAYGRSPSAIRRGIRQPELDLRKQNGEVNRLLE